MSGLENRLHEAFSEPNKPSPKFSKSDIRGLPTQSFEEAALAISQTVQAAIVFGRNLKKARGLNLAICADELSFGSSCSGLCSEHFSAEIIQNNGGPALKAKYTCDRAAPAQAVMIQKACCAFKDVLDKLPSDVLQELDGKTYAEQKNIISRAKLEAKAFCLKHNHDCWIPLVDIDISSIPCTDSSRQNPHPLGKEGKTARVGLTHWTWHQEAKTKMLLMENVLTGDIQKVTQDNLNERGFDAQLITTTPRDTGFGLNSRDRGYIGAANKAKGRLLGNLQVVYDCLCVTLREKQVPNSAAWFNNDPADLELELSFLDTQSRLKAVGHDFLSTTTAWEIDNLRRYETLWQKKYGIDPRDDPIACFMLGENPETHQRMTNKDGVFPLWLHSASSHRCFNSNRGRCIGAGEKLATMGFPVTKEMAKAYKCTLLNWRTLSKPHGLIGNSVHLPNQLIALLTVLLCTELYPDSIDLSLQGIKIPDDWMVELRKRKALEEKEACLISISLSLSLFSSRWRVHRMIP